VHSRDPILAPIHRLMAFSQAVHVKRMIEGVALEGGFKGSMQHTDHRAGGRSVSNEAASKDLLFGKPEGFDVGTQEEWRDAA
jgi:hypothetical protein